jgi:predicted ATP-dependent protease
MSGPEIAITIEVVFCVALLGYMVRLVIKQHTDGKRAEAERAEQQKLRDQERAEWEEKHKQEMAKIERDRAEREQERAAESARREQEKRDKEAATLAALIKTARQQVRLADGGDLTDEEIEADRLEKEIDEFKRFCFLFVKVAFEKQFEFKQDGLRATMSFRGQDFEIRPAGPDKVQFFAAEGPLLGTFDRMDENVTNRMVVAMDDYTGSAE